MRRMIFQRGGAWLTVLLLAFPLAAASNPNKAMEIKSAFIYNFVHFLKWPGAKELKENIPANVVICTLDAQDIADMKKVFDQASKRSGGQRTYVVKAKANWSGAGSDCHILFIGSAQKANASAILSDLRNQPVLTVSDIGGFAAQGGMIEFSNVGDKVKIGVVNKGAVVQAGLHIGSDLLQVALKVINE